MHSQFEKDEIRGTCVLILAVPGFIYCMWCLLHCFIHVEVLNISFKNAGLQQLVSNNGRLLKKTLYKTYDGSAIYECVGNDNVMLFLKTTYYNIPSASYLNVPKIKTKTEIWT